MSESETEEPSVAIACQGGGSHTAFTAGVLDRLLEADAVPFEIAGLSGTSGGAICAFATWFGLASESGREGRARARQLLSQIWDDLGAREPMDAMVNAVGVGLVRVQSAGVPFPTASPYDTPVSDWSRDQLRETLEAAVDPDALAALRDRDDRALPRLDIGAVDVQRGTFRTFTERDVSHDAVLASAAVPNLFQAAPVVQADGTTRWYWDGLFSQNPPLEPLVEAAPGRRGRPDELWIVQINPQRESEIPTDLEAIADRRNELGGNLSVNQELGFIRQRNQWAASGALRTGYEPVAVKTINLDEAVASPDRPFDYATKLDRSPRFLDRLWEHGRSQAEQFLAVERDRRRVRAVLETLWTEERTELREAWSVPDYRSHLPTSLVELRSFLQGGAEQATATLGLAEAIEFQTAIERAISDLSFLVEEVIAEEDAVASRWRATGTHDGELAGIDPTGRDVTLSGMRIDHLRDGKLTESWTLVEQWSLLRQLESLERGSGLSTTRRVTATPVVTQLSAPAENEELAQIEVETVWNEGRREGLDRVLGDDCVLYLDDENDLRGREAYWAFVQRYRAAFPDLQLTIEDTVSEGDKIALRLRLRGTHEGTILGVEPTGERIDVTRMVVHHLDDGRVVETGIVEDTVRLLHQLGATPP